MLNEIYKYDANFVIFHKFMRFNNNDIVCILE